MGTVRPQRVYSRTTPITTNAAIRETINGGVAQRNRHQIGWSMWVLYHPVPKKRAKWTPIHFAIPTKAATVTPPIVPAIMPLAAVS